MAQVLVRVAYAHRRTHATVWVEVASAIVALACAAIGAQAFGLAGVAAAVPAYCAIQLALTAYVARGARRNLAEEG
jgi:peptidoglycan biosynthesis protein MviN/MurJ (putative lipid II flippase)